MVSTLAILQYGYKQIKDDTDHACCGDADDHSRHDGNGMIKAHSYMCACLNDTVFRH